jgi:hypothetical protein
MDTYWQEEFRRRIERFGAASTEGLVPVSIKIRITSGCFHREHSPEAFRLIDRYLAGADLADVHYQVEEHESGPEILVYLALAAAGLGFAKSIVELVTTIIKARSEGIKKGDRPSDPLELIVRGYRKDGEYFEETVLRIPPHQNITPKQIEDTLSKKTRQTQKIKRKKK